VLRHIITAAKQLTADTITVTPLAKQPTHTLKTAAVPRAALNTELLLLHTQPSVRFAEAI